MILQYFIRNENKDKNLAKDIYSSLVNLSKEIITKEILSIKNDFNSSFEIMSLFIFVIFYSYKGQKKTKRINQEIMNLYVLDIDKSLRELGIGDTQIGKYVKSYVKKVYFRIKKLEHIFENDNKVDFQSYINKVNISSKIEDNKELSVFLFKVLKKLIKRAENEVLSKNIIKNLIK